MFCASSCSLGLLTPESVPPAPRETCQKRNLRDFSFVREIRGPVVPDQTSLLECLRAQCATSIDLRVMLSGGWRCGLCPEWASRVSVQQGDDGAVSNPG